MTDRPRSFADMLSPQQIRQYMQEVGYEQPTQPQVSPLPTPTDVPSQAPPQLVEFRGSIEFQAFWELPAVSNRSRDELIVDIMGALSGQEAPWLPTLRYHVVPASLHRIDANARPLPQAADPRPTWQAPNGSLWKVNQDGSLEALAGTPPQSTPNGWMAATPRVMPIPEAPGREEAPFDGRIAGLETLAASLAAQLDAMESERTHRREARRQRRVHRGDVPADGDGTAPLPATPVREAGGPGGGRRGATGAAPHAGHPGDDGGGGGDDRTLPAGGDAEAVPDRDEGRTDRPKRKPAVPSMKTPKTLPTREDFMTYSGGDGATSLPQPEERPAPSGGDDPLPALP